MKKYIQRQLSARLFLDILNTPFFRRLYSLTHGEYIGECDITNNTVLVKIFDRKKQRELKQGTLKTPAPSMFDLKSPTRKHPLGRFNSIRTPIVINALNLHYKPKFNLLPEDTIIKLIPFGKTSVQVYAMKEEDENEK